MNSMKSWAQARLNQWLEPMLFQPFVFGVFISLTLSEFVRGALALSLLPTYGRTVLGFAVEWTALALSIHYLADNLLRAPAGWIADKYGQRVVLLLGFCIATVSVIWMMNAHTVPSLIGSLTLYGFGVTPMWPAAISSIGIATPENKRAVFMGYLYIFWLAGAGLGPVLINFLIDRSYRLSFVVLVCVEVLAFVMVFLFVRKSGVRFRVGSDAEPGNAAHTHHHRLDRAYFQSLWRNVKEVAFLFPGMFAQTFAVASLIPILSLYANVILHLTGAMYSTILIAGGGLTVLLLIPAGKLVDRYGPRRFLVSAFIIAGVSLGIYPLVRSLPTTFLAVSLLGACYAFILPAWNSVLDRSIDPDKKGTLWGVFMTVEGLGSAVGPYLGGIVWDRISPTAPFMVSAGVIFIMGLLYLVLPIEVVRRGGVGKERDRTRGADGTNGANGTNEANGANGANGTNEENGVHGATDGSYSTGNRHIRSEGSSRSLFRPRQRG